MRYSLLLGRFFFPGDIATACARINVTSNVALCQELAEIIDVASKVREKLVQIVCLDNLEFLHRGGRIGNATRFIGSLLEIKPLVQINHKTGLVESAGQARTPKKSIDTLVSRFFEQITREHLNELRFSTGTLSPMHRHWRTGLKKISTLWNSLSTSRDLSWESIPVRGRWRYADILKIDRCLGFLEKNL